MGTAIIEKTGMIEWGVAARPLTGQTVSGDLHLVECCEHGALLAVIDGVGHGGQAGAVAEAAAKILREHAEEPVMALVQRCHEALARTRGVVMTLASVDVLDNTVTWMGVGNVEARLFRVEAETSYPCEHILLRSGLIGLQLPALQASMMSLAPGDLLVFATDGIQVGFEARIKLNDPVQQIADRILKQYFKGTDDALVLVVRYSGSSL